MVPTGIVPVGVYENATAVHVDPVCEAIVATGLIVTDTVNGAPVVQVLPLLVEVGVTLYVAVAATESVLPSVAVTEPGVPVLAAPPVMPAPVGTDHAYVVFDGIRAPVGV